MDQKGEQFTEEKLEIILKESANYSANEIITIVRKAIEEHTEGTYQSDDITMLVLKAL